ncbi:TadE/TadG family type IV pilus assembly protein [Phenylobacterium aquaticum]|uniref:TadE/TadG family type IV pilus assembly protein n=1 Tax=Phenylobacterium aquaticum TaxID=1763816 RepID=UPI0026ED0866|nr:TadE/TadG family type IV pilus assembly protein [Phenylobacterium aquaticum]
MSRWFSRDLKRGLKDDRGSAAVEFAFVAPLMILLYYGLSETTIGMICDRRASHVASTVGDLVAQDTQVTTAEMTDIFNVGKAIIAPFPTTTLNMRVTSVKADSSGTPKVVWSKTYGSSYSALTGTVSGVPTGLLAVGDTAIMSEVTYTYASPLQKTLPTPITFTQKYYLKPRKTTEVTWSTA